MCLARYADRDGRCWPSMRQLAADSRMSLATVCRYLKSMAELGVFQRARRGVGRYSYRLAEAYVPRLPGRVSSAPTRTFQGKEHDKQDHRRSYKNHTDYDKQSIKHADSPPPEPPLTPAERAGFAKRLGDLVASLRADVTPPERAWRAQPWARAGLEAAG